MSSYQTQNKRLLSLLRVRKSKGVTPLEALDEIGSLRLGARIFELRRQGHDIVTERVPISNRRYVARYVLINYRDRS